MATTWSWNGGTADWYGGDNWTPGASSTATYPQAGDSATISNGLATITAADVAAHGTLNDLSIYLAGGALSATNETFGPTLALFTEGARTSSTLTLGGDSTIAGYVSLLTSSDTLTLDADTLVNIGFINGGVGSDLLNIVATDLINTGSILVGASQDQATISANGVVLNDGQIDVTRSKLVIDGSVAGLGTIEISRYGMVALGAVSPEQTVLFGAIGIAQTLIVTSTEFHGLITGFGGGDEIDLPGIVATGYTYDSSDGVLSLIDNTTTVATLEFAGTLFNNSFDLLKDANGDALLAPIDDRSWIGGTGDWYAASGSKWGIKAPPYTSGYPQPGDEASITTGTAEISAADVTEFGTLNNEDIVLGSGLTAPAAIEAADETFGPGIVLEADANAALDLTGPTGFAGYALANGQDDIFALNDTGAFTNTGKIFTANLDRTTMAAPTIVNDGLIAIAQATLTITEGVVLGTGALQLGSNGAQVYPGRGQAALIISSGVSVSSSQHIDFMNGLDDVLIVTLANPGAFMGQIEGFVSGDAIGLGGVVATSETYDPKTGMLLLAAAAGDTPLATLDIGLGFTTNDIMLQTGANSTTLTTDRATGDGPDEALAGPQARADYNVDGSGIIVGIISNSINAGGRAVSAAIADGDLPSATYVLKDGASSDDNEGLAMAELIHRIAPGATIMFYTADDGLPDMAAGIGSLAADGANIIVDDIVSGIEPYFEDGSLVGTAIQKAIAGGVDYFTSMGNYGSLYYQGTYSELDTALPGLGEVKANDFGGGNPLQALTISGGTTISLEMQWNQPYYGIGGSAGSQNSMSMYLYNANDQIVASGTISAVDGDPVQTLVYANTLATGVFHLAIVWDEGSAMPGTFKYIDYDKTGLVIDDPNAEQGSGTVSGHQLAAGANVVAAAVYTDTPAFGATDPATEPFSDVGSGEFLIGTNGQPLATPVSAGEPTFTAVDGDSTSSLDPFYGTSAAAPAAAAVAALMLQADPNLTPSQVTAMLEASAINLNEPSDLQGAGLIQADKAVQLAEEAAACYGAGTRILTEHGDVAVEQLRVGDRVRTAGGALRPVRWIGHRSYDGRFIAGNRDVLPILLHAGALADGIPSRDLMVSPKHAMFLDGALVPAELLVNGVSIVQLAHADGVTYYHIELDSHDILVAEGALSESFIDHDSRLMFQNAAEFLLLHPAPAKMEDCAPRVEDGDVLVRVRQRIAARAGLPADHVDDAAEDGPLDGRIDVLDEHEVSGWAFDATRSRTPVKLEILDGRRVIGTVAANRFRPDLRQAMLGDGRCAYVFSFDAPPEELRAIRVRRASDGAAVIGNGAAEAVAA